MNSPWLQGQFLENRIVRIISSSRVSSSSESSSNVLFRIIFRDSFTGLLKNVPAGVDVTQLRELLRKPFGLFILLISVYIGFLQLHWPASWHLPTEENFGIRFVIWKAFQMLIILSLKVDPDAGYRFLRHRADSTC